MRRQFVCVSDQPNLVQRRHSISTLEPIDLTGRKSETVIPRISKFLVPDNDFPAF